jgi:hypothetical protein
MMRFVAKASGAYALTKARWHRARDQRSDVRGQKSEIRDERSEVRDQMSAGIEHLVTDL